jgi:hypothetical protein
MFERNSAEALAVLVRRLDELITRTAGAAPTVEEL